MAGRGSPMSPAVTTPSTASPTVGSGRGARPSPSVATSFVISPPPVSHPSAPSRPLQEGFPGRGDGGGRGGGADGEERKAPLRLKPFLPQLLDLRPPETKSNPSYALYGISGNEVMVKTNFMSICKPLKQGEEFKKLYTVKTYYVEFSPLVFGRQQKDDIIKRFFTSTLKLDPKKACFHMQGNYMVVPATPLVDVSKEFRPDTSYQVDGIQLKFSLRRTSDASTADCLALVDTLLNSMIRKAGYKFLNNIAINLKSAKPIPEINEATAVQGFVPTVSPVEAGLYLQVGLQVKVLSKDPLSVMLKRKEQQSRSPVDFRDWCEKQLGKRYVMATHNDVFYQIASFNWKADETHTVELSTGRSVTIRDYFKERYGQTLDTKEYIIMVKSLQIGNEPKRKMKKGGKPGGGGDGGKPEEAVIAMPASRLCLVSIHPDIRDDARKMRNVLAVGRKEPHEYYDSLGKFAGLFFENQEIRDEMTKWGFEFLSEDDLKPARARALGVQSLYSQDTVREHKYDEATADWARNVRASPVARQGKNPGPIRLVFLAGDREMQLAHDFFPVLQKACAGMGIKFAEPMYAQVNGRDHGAWGDAVSSELGKNRPVLDMVLTLLPDDNAERYNAIKKMTVLSQHAITSQCVKAYTIKEQKKQMTVATKLGMQMCAKLGGAIWRSQFANLNLTDPLFIGILVHKMPRSFDKFATIVANTDRNVSAWTLEVVPTISMKDAPRAIADIAKCVKSCTEAFIENNKKLPSHVIIHRLEDNDNMMEHHHQEEGPKLVDTVFAACSSNMPKVVYMLATKQTKTRFWKHNGAQHTNCVPGTVLDTDIVSPLRNDFYLISSAPRQGISGPTYYNVLINTGAVSMDTLELATYRMTMLYYNWTGPVSIPATLQYALKAAKLIGDNLGHEGALVVANASFGLRSQLFYL